MCLFSRASTCHFFVTSLIHLTTLQPQGVVDDTNIRLIDFFAALNADAFHIHLTHHLANIAIAVENVATIPQIVTRMIEGVGLIFLINKNRNHLQRFTQRIHTHQLERWPAIMSTVIVFGATRSVNKILVHIPFALFTKPSMSSQPTESRPIRIHTLLMKINMLAVTHPCLDPIEFRLSCIIKEFRISDPIHPECLLDPLCT